MGAPTPVGELRNSPAVNGEAERARKLNVIERPLTSPRYLGYTELLIRRSAADQQIGYVIRLGTRTITSTIQRCSLKLERGLGAGIEHRCPRVGWKVPDKARLEKQQLTTKRKRKPTKNEDQAGQRWVLGYFEHIQSRTAPMIS